MFVSADCGSSVNIDFNYVRIGVGSRGPDIPIKGATIRAGGESSVFLPNIVSTNNGGGGGNS